MNRRNFLKSAVVAPLTVLPNVTVGIDGVTKIEVQGGYIIIDKSTHKLIVDGNPHILQIHRKICDLQDDSPNVGLDILSTPVFNRISDRIFELNKPWSVIGNGEIQFTGGSILNSGISSYQFLRNPETIHKSARYYADNSVIELDWNREYRSYRPVQRFIFADNFSCATYDFPEITTTTHHFDNIVPL